MSAVGVNNMFNRRLTTRACHRDSNMFWANGAQASSLSNFLSQLGAPVRMHENMGVVSPDVGRAVLQPRIREDAEDLGRTCRRLCGETLSRRLHRRLCNWTDILTSFDRRFQDDVQQHAAACSRTAPEQLQLQAPVCEHEACQLSKNHGDMGLQAAPLTGVV